MITLWIDREGYPHNEPARTRRAMKILRAEEKDRNAATEYMTHAADAARKHEEYANPASRRHILGRIRHNASIQLPEARDSTGQMAAKAVSNWREAQWRKTAPRDRKGRIIRAKSRFRGEPPIVLRIARLIPLGEDAQGKQGWIAEIHSGRKEKPRREFLALSQGKNHSIEISW